MNDSKHPTDVDVSKALAENYESVEMDESYRRNLLATMLNTAKPRRLPGLRWLYGAAAAAVIIFAYLGITHFVGTSPANDRLFAVTEVSRVATDGSGHQLKVGDYVASGETISTGIGARVTLVAKNGSLIYLDESTELRVDTRGRATISRGRLYCSNRLHEIKAIQTPAGSIRLLGTVLDAAVVKRDTAEVTVVEGRVELSNSHGKEIISAGSSAVLVASQAPENGRRTDVAAATAWYHDRNSMVSAADEIAYVINRSRGVPREQRSAMTELWAMGSDGSNKRLVKTLLGSYNQLGGWWPGSRWILLRSQGPLNLVDRDRPIQTEVLRLVSVATGQDSELPLPAGFNLESGASVSPDGGRLAFCGGYDNSRIYAGNCRPPQERAIWTYDVRSREMKRFPLDPGCACYNPPDWSPDGRWLVTHEQRPASLPFDMVLVDTRTGKTTHLGEGQGPMFSPDGRKLAYVAVEYKGYGRSDYIGILDVFHGDVVRLPVKEKMSNFPAWSPRGDEVAFVTRRFTEHSYSIHAARADGTNVREVYSAKGNIHSISWSRDGKSIYVRCWTDGVAMVAADGSGLVANLGGNESDSVLPSRVLEQIEQAGLAIANANRDMYELGYTRVFQGRLEEGRRALRDAASSLSSLPWAYPLARISVPDITAEADALQEAASAKDSTLLSLACWYRMSQVAYLGLGNYCWKQPKGQAKLPPDIQSLEKSGCFGISAGTPDTRVADLKCPGKDHPKPVPFIYTPPKDGVPEIGDVIFQCPNHPEHRVVWNSGLEWKRNTAAREWELRK